MCWPAPPNNAGQYTNPQIHPSTTEVQQYSVTFSNITVSAGATVRVEFDSDSNGLVPEPPGFTCARGRWRKLVSSPNVPAPPGVWAETGGVVVMECEKIRSPGLHTWRVLIFRIEFISAMLRPSVCTMKHTVPRSLLARSPFAALLLTALVTHAADPQPGWVDLFDGKTLNGWTRLNGTATYQVEDGTIVGRTATGSPNSFLCTDRSYGNFELEFEVKVDAGLNSGVQIRSRTKDTSNTNDPGRVYGPQVEIESSGAKGAEAGYVYGEATGRGWLTPPDYRVVATGPRIQTWINGTAIEDITDEAMFQTHPTGFIGLQVHSVPKTQKTLSVAWRNLCVRETGAP